MRHFLSLFFGVVLLSLLPTKTWCQETNMDTNEAYVAITNNSSKMTFYYDDKREERGGTIFGIEPDEYGFPVWQGFNGVNIFESKVNFVEEVVFDPSFANARPKTTSHWFSGMFELTTFTGMEYLNTSEVNDMSLMFNMCINLTELDVSSFDVSSLKSADRMFAYCSALQTLTIASGMENIDGNACEGLGWYDDPRIIIAPEGFDFGVDTTGEYFKWKSGYFKGQGLPPVPVPEAYAALSNDGQTLTFYYDTNRSTKEENTYDLNYAWELPGWIAGWEETTPITNVVFDSSFADARPQCTFCWFYQMEDLKEITGLSYLNTSEVTNMGQMFKDCKSLQEIDVSHFDTSNVTWWNATFWGCSSLKKIDVSNFDLSQSTKSNYMFYDCDHLEELSISASMRDIEDTACKGIGSSKKPCLIIAPEGFDFDVDTSGNLFTWKSGYFTLNHSNNEAYAWYSEDEKTFTFCYDDIRDERAGNTYDLNEIGVNPTWLNGREQANIVQKVIFNPSFADVRPTNTYRWFFNMSDLEEIIGLNHLNTSFCTSMYYMFAGCKKLKTLDVSNFDLSNVSSTRMMFGASSGLEKLTISSSMSNLDNSACVGVGTQETPCTLIAPEDFDFGVDTSGYYFIWKSGYFKLENTPLLVTLSNSDNEVSLSVYDGMTVDVVLEEYTCQSEKWNSLCVPFDISNAQLKDAFGEDVDIQEMTGCSWDSENLILVMNFNKVTEVLAGRPYLLRVTGDVETPHFNGVTINSDNPQTLNFGNCEMSGVFNATPFPWSGMTYLFIINDQFYTPAYINPLPAMRCYFHLLGDAANANVAVLNMENDADGIVTVINDRGTDTNAYYSVQGVSTTHPKHGIFIKNGRKIVIK